LAGFSPTIRFGEQELIPALQLHLTHDATVGGVKVPAGTYGVFTIPGVKEWTVILSKDNNLWGSDAYNKANDAARFYSVPPEKSNQC
jgi:hypothetical protein